jgi:hypothetical protein
MNGSHLTLSTPGPRTDGQSHPLVPRGEGGHGKLKGNQLVKEIK